MGGPGSGRWPSFGSHASLYEHALAIDLAALKRDGYLFTGFAGKINWWRHDQIVSWINYRDEDAGPRLIYRTRDLGSDWRRVDDLIPFVETPNRFGGRRRWLLCPGCQRRCRIVYSGLFSLQDLSGPEVREPIRGSYLPGGKPAAQASPASWPTGFA